MFGNPPLSEKRTVTGMKITARIENAIGDALVRTEAGRISRSGRANIQAWQLRIQAWEGFHRWDRQACLRGVELGREAIRLDPHESDGYAATAIERLLGLDPRYSVKRALRKHPYRDLEDREKLANALTQAGLS
jgi:hypothetical protein